MPMTIFKFADQFKVNSEILTNSEFQMEQQITVLWILSIISGGVKPSGLLN